MSRFFFTKNRKRLELAAIGMEIEAFEKSERTIFKTFARIKQLEIRKKMYHDEFLGGQKTLSELDEAIEKLHYPPDVSNETRIRVVENRLNFGTEINYIQNGIRIGLTSFIVALVLYSIYFKANIDTLSSNRHDLLDVFFPAIKIGLGGFCFGLFYPYIIGDSGMKKGFFFGSLIALVEIPQAYLTGQLGLLNLMCIPFLKEILVFTLVGFITDVSTLVRIYRRDFKLKFLIQVEGWKTLIGLGVFVLGAIATGIIGLISDKVGILLSNFLK